MKNHNILITSAGRRVELVQAFQNALKAHIPDAQVFTADLYPDFSSACQISDKSFKVPKVESNDFISSLIQICKDNEVALVVPTIDTELIKLAENKSLFFENGITPIVSSVDLISICRDKRKSGELFLKNDVDTPKIYPKNKIEYPCFCKPYDGSSSVGAKILHSPDMLDEQTILNKKNIFMELIGPEYCEYTVDAYYDRQSKLRCLVPRERIAVRSGEVSKGITRKDFVYDYLLDRLTFLAGAKGCITIQVFGNIHTKDVKGLEINARFGGGFPLSHSAGADYPDWLIREYLFNETIAFSDKWAKNLLMLRYDAKVLVSHD